jgi:hypothetical protein
MQQTSTPVGENWSQFGFLEAIQRDDTALAVEHHRLPRPDGPRKDAFDSRDEGAVKPRSGGHL